MYTGLTYIEAVSHLFSEAKVQYSFGEKGVKTKQEYRYPKLEELNNREKVYKYLGQRKISKETINKCDIREDAHGNIVFNYYDTNDVLTLVKYRPSHRIDKSKGELKNWCQKDSDTTPLLFNMNRINIEQPLLITEGEIDALAAIESGYPNTVSVPFGANNFGWIEENFEWLEQFNSIIICSDNDEAGLKMQKECTFRLGSWRTKFIEIPKQHIDTETGEISTMKDLNHVLYYKGKQAVMNLILTAKDPGVPSVIDFSDIEDIDLDEIDGIKTGIKQLDNELMKLFYGTLTVTTGTPGSGKSSFISQLVCQTADQDKGVWLFSRELPNWMTKSWMYHVFAGSVNINEYDDDGTPYYKVIPDAKKKIKEYYKGKITIYRDDWSNKLDDLIISATDCVRKYGAKLVIFDNLMTIDLTTNETNEMQKQTECLNKLIAFATKYHVAVVLIAHPRKMERNTEVGLYDVSGSSNIANLAHRTISLKRLNKEKNESQYDVELTIIKDRMRGRLNKKINMYYDAPSRRFYTNEQEFRHQYKWDTIKHIKKIKYPHEEGKEIFGEIRD